MNKKIFLAGCFFGMSALSVEAQQVWTPDNGDGTFTNPIMWGDWPDPDVIRVGDDFYFILLHSLGNPNGEYMGG